MNLKNINFEGSEVKEADFTKSNLEKSTQQYFRIFKDFDAEAEHEENSEASRLVDRVAFSAKRNVSKSASEGKALDYIKESNRLMVRLRKEGGITQVGKGEMFTNTKPVFNQKKIEEILGAEKTKSILSDSELAEMSSDELEAYLTEQEKLQGKSR